jgi:superfamily I DNA/RNA helicase
LPELVAQLQMVAAGRRTLNIMRGGELGYEPKPGRISLATQHSSKGLEWDAVFLVGIDGMWIPGTLEAPFLGVHDFLGGDPNAEATAQLRYLMRAETGLHANRTATESAHIEVILRTVAPALRRHHPPAASCKSAQPRHPPPPR